MPKSPKILLTGGTGFLGSHLVDRLVALGHSIRVLVRSTSSLKYIQPHVESGKVDVIQCDLTDKQSLDAAIRNITWIYNCAACVGFYPTTEELRKVNVFGLKCLAEAAVQHKIARFIHISSIGVYSWTDGPIHETTPIRPMNQYERTKAEGESILLQMHQQHGLPIIILQPSFIYGPRAKIGMRELFWYIRKPWLPLVDKGKHRLNMIYISDVIDALVHVKEINDAVGERFIIGHHDHPTYREIIRTASEILDIPTTRLSLPFRIVKPLAYLTQKLGFTPKSNSIPYSEFLKYMNRDGVLNISKAKRMLDFDPKINLEEGLRRTVTWFQENEGI